MRFALIIILAVVFSACHKHCEKPSCDVPATVTDLSKQNGSGFGFTLADGTVIVPETASVCPQKHSPLQNFQLVDGMKVMIGYESDHHAGSGVHITCITEVSEKDQ